MSLPLVLCLLLLLRVFSACKRNVAMAMCLSLCASARVCVCVCVSAMLTFGCSRYAQVVRVSKGAEQLKAVPCSVHSIKKRVGIERERIMQTRSKRL